MAATAIGKNAALKALTEKMKKVGLAKTLRSDKPETSATAQKKISVATAKANGYVNNRIVVFKALTGGVTSFVVGRPYFVVGEATGTFELADEAGGTGIEILGHAIESSSELELLEELSGGGYARVATAWNTPAHGEVTESAAPKIKVPAGLTPTYAIWCSVTKLSEEATPGESTYAVNKLSVAETFVAEGELELTSDKLESGTTVA